MEKWFGKDSIAGKAARGAIGLAGLPFKAMTAPFRALGGIGDAIRMKQINTMNASYMTAEERMEFMKSKNKKVSKLDEMMAGADKDTLKEPAAFAPVPTVIFKEAGEKTGFGSSNLNFSLENSSIFFSIVIPFPVSSIRSTSLYR